MSGSGAWRKFVLLLWKNYLIQKRRVIVTIFEIGIPAFFAFILVLIRLRVDLTNISNATQWPAYDVSQFPPNLTKLFSDGPPEIAYYPNNSVVDSVISNASIFLKTFHATGFANEDELNAYVMNKMNFNTDTRKSILGSVIFKNSFEDDTLPSLWSYEIRLSYSPINDPENKPQFSFFKDSRWNTDLNYPKFQLVGPRDKKYSWGGQPGYMREGFLSLQHAIDRAIICQHNSTAGCTADQTLQIKMQRTPYPAYEDDPFVLIVQQQFPFILILSFVLCALFIVKDVVHEKERKLKESMKMMGLPNWLHWLAWFIKYFLFLLISVILMTFFFSISTGEHGSVMQKTDPSVTFVFLLLYAVSTISFSFMISVFFSKANAGAAAGGILFFITYIPYLFIQPRYESLSLASKLMTCLISNVAMAYGCQVFGMFEGTGEGVQWSNIHRGATVDDTFTMLDVYIMLLVDSLLYGLVTWYVENVFPGEYGIPKPAYFPFMSSYWCGTTQSLEVDAESEPLLNRKNHHSNHEFFESEPINLHTGINIQGLTKKFGQLKAVDGMSLNMYDGQITALLGHNGAGKTTTMSMLTGFIPASSGTAWVNGFNIRTDIDKVRSSLGLCPQHDVLFDTLTVHEHLTFFAKLKGYPSDKVPNEVSKMIEQFNLQDKTNAQSKTLSGGMKRKLSVGIALIGDSKIVILDEPTSGMDPNARRHTWDILQKHRQGRTLILTTHYMDEADLLGDRIAIMSKGVVQCCGSSLFLKNKYGAGYHMVIVKQSHCDIDLITKIIQTHVPMAVLESNVSAELAFRLPHESSPSFEALFTELEQQRELLGIASFGASVTTMEEVFIRVGEDNDMGLSQANKIVANGGPYGSQGSQAVTDTINFQKTGTIVDVALNTTVTPATDVPFAICRRNTQFRLYAQQFRAMFWKRVLNTKRNIIVSVCQLMVPLFFTVLALIVVKTMPAFNASPFLKLDLEKFDSAIVPYAFDANSTAVANLAPLIAAAYKKEFQHKYDTVEVKQDDITPYFIKMGKENFVKYTTELLSAASFIYSGEEKLKLIAHFNDQAYHTPGISLNALDNAILSYYTNGKASIETSNHPLPKSIKEKSTSTDSDLLAFSIAYNVNFGMAFLASSFVLFLIRERTDKSKHVQFVSGVHAINYWISTFCWDLINYIIPCIALVISFVAFSIDPFTVDSHWVIILFLFLLHGWAMLPFMYLWSFLFKVPSTGLVWVTMFNILAGTATILAIGIISIPQLDLETLAQVLDWVFVAILPHYNLGQGLEDFYINYENKHTCTLPEVTMILPYVCHNKTFMPGVVTYYPQFPCCIETCTEYCLTYDTNFMGWKKPGIGRELVFLTLQGFLYFGIIFLIESRLLVRVWYNIFRKDKEEKSIAMKVDGRGGLMRQASYVEEDDDVQAERSRIAQQQGISDSLILRNLTKVYGHFVAVDRLSVGIPQGECFGLLGINGAGKTTTFKMMTGDEMITDGNAILSGYDIKNNIREVQRRLGYCPQFDALIGKMTGRETLFMFGRLRGVLESQLPQVVDSLLSSLLLDLYADKLVEQYSGGNKRKLSTAVALIGDPPVIFLDEPTTGMDPVARRLLWNTLTAVRDSGRTLVLTSHSMEECEALCTRLAIMVNGQFKCLGATQHLKNKFGEGYTLIAKVQYTNSYHQTEAEPDLNPLMDFITEQFPGSVLKDVHQGQVHFHIPISPEVTWAKIFGTLERAKSTYQIEDYSVSQTTLEQVFINFARAQHTVENLSKTGCCGGCC